MKTYTHKLYSFLLPSLIALLLIGTISNIKADSFAEVRDIIGIKPLHLDPGLNDIAYEDLIYFHGEIKKVKKCFVHFKATDGNTYKIPGDQIYAYRVEDPVSDLNDIMASVVMDNTENCSKGMADAQMHHKKALGNYAGGFLLGIFWVIGAAVASPTPMKGKNTMALSENSELFTDPYYLDCYKKKAKTTNVLAAVGGWATWIAVVLLASSGG